jgi:isopropylmalate/homocitrate/citramalate synthase
MLKKKKLISNIVIKEKKQSKHKIKSIIRKKNKKITEENLQNLSNPFKQAIWMIIQ